MLRVGHGQRARPRPARAARARAPRPARRAPEPGLPRRRADRPRGRRRSSARRTTTSSTSASASASTSSPRECEALLDETEGLWETEGDRLFRERLGIGLADARPADVSRLFRAPELDRPTRPTACCPRSRRRSPTSASTCAPSRTSTSTSSSGPARSPRAFCSPIEVPGKVMLVIQPIGGHDDWRALFHEAGHTEHYANTSPDLPMEARRLGDMAVTEGWAVALRAPRRRAGLAQPPPRRPERRGDRERRARSRASTSSAATARSSSTRSSSSRPPTPQTMRAAVRGAPHRGAEDPGEPGELPRRHRRRLLRHRLPALVGVRGAAARLPPLRVRERLVRPARRRRPASRAVVARPGPDGRASSSRMRPGSGSRWALGRRAHPRRPRALDRVTADGAGRRRSPEVRARSPLQLSNRFVTLHRIKPKRSLIRCGMVRIAAVGPRPNPGVRG